jgi:hypothetical protein
MTEQRRQPSLSATERANGAGDCRPVPEEYKPSAGAEVEIHTPTGSDLSKLLTLLIALTLACGAAAGVAVNFAPAYLDGAGDGY